MSRRSARGLARRREGLGLISIFQERQSGSGDRRSRGLVQFAAHGLVQGLGAQLLQGVAGAFEVIG